MAITTNFGVRINDSGYVVFSHPHDEQEAYDYLEKVIDQNELQTIFTTTFGSSPKTDTPQSRDWIVNNYEGIKKVAVDYGEKLDFRISNSVLELLR